MPSLLPSSLHSPREVILCIDTVIFLFPWTSFIERGSCRGAGSQASLARVILKSCLCCRPSGPSLLQGQSRCRWVSGTKGQQMLWSKAFIQHRQNWCTGEVLEQNAHLKLRWVSPVCPHGCGVPGVSLHVCWSCAPNPCGKAALWLSQLPCWGFCLFGSSPVCPPVRCPMGRCWGAPGTSLPTADSITGGTT